MDALFRWNIERVATFSDTPFYGYNLKLLTDIYKLYTKDAAFFQVNPVIGFKPVHFFNTEEQFTRIQVVYYVVYTTGV